MTDEKLQPMTEEEKQRLIEITERCILFNYISFKEVIEAIVISAVSADINVSMYNLLRTSHNHIMQGHLLNALDVDDFPESAEDMAAIKLKHWQME